MEIKKYKFHQHKCPILIDNRDINKIAVSNKESFGKRDFDYFIGYKNAKKLAYIFLPKKVHVKRF